MSRRDTFRRLRGKRPPLSAEPLISMIMLYMEHCKGIKGAS